MKKIDTSAILIEKIVVHSIPKHKKDDFSVIPEYSEQESDLPDGLRLFFKEKVVQSLDSNKELRVIYNYNSLSPVSGYINTVIDTSGSELVSQSKLMTEYLFRIQTGQNASGLLVVMYGKISDKGCCIIIKLERDEGAQLKIDPVTKSFNIVEVKDLMLTRKTKIYKVGLFINKENFKVGFDGKTADLQIDPKVKKEITTWFIEDFLGCIPLEDPKSTTKKLYEYTTTFIQTIGDPIKQVKYISDLNSYLQKNTVNISSTEFADDYMETEDKDNYMSYLKDKKFNSSEFPKDLSLVDNKIKKIALYFENDISIVGNKGILENNVKLEVLKNGQTKAEIVSKLRNVK